MVSSGYDTAGVPINSHKSMTTCPKPGQDWAH